VLLLERLDSRSAPTRASVAVLEDARDPDRITHRLSEFQA
jgi:hypothetical protein